MTTAAPALTRTQRRKAQTRSHLLEAAAEVIAERGFAEAKVHDIAARADIGTGTFYNYFRSKDEIFEALITDTIAGLAAELDAARDDQMSPRDRLQTGWRAVLTYADANRARLLVFFGEGHGFHAFMQQAYETFAADYETELRDAIAAGDVRPCNTSLLSAAVVGLASQAVSWWLNHPDVAMETVVQEIATFEWHALRRTAEDPGSSAADGHAHLGPALPADL